MGKAIQTWMSSRKWVWIVGETFREDLCLSWSLQSHAGTIIIFIVIDESINKLQHSFSSSFVFLLTKNIFQLNNVQLSYVRNNFFCWNVKLVIFILEIWLTKICFRSQILVSLIEARSHHGMVFFLESVLTVIFLVCVLYMKDFQTSKWIEVNLLQ